MREKMTQQEWLTYFRSIGMDNGTVWHMMAGIAMLGLIKT